MQRRNDYRICQWNVLDPLPQIAPLLPAERPEQAPPRKVAAKSGTRPEKTRQGAEQGDAAKSGTPQPGEPAGAAQATRKVATKKKRR
jgi:hypothetical protein